MLYKLQSCQWKSDASYCSFNVLLYFNYSYFHMFSDATEFALKLLVCGEAQKLSVSFSFLVFWTVQHCSIIMFALLQTSYALQKNKRAYSLQVD